MSGAAAVAELQPGHLFAERYAIEELIGRGGMGAVYRVRDFALGEPIALKVLLTDDTEPTPAALVRFRQEVRLARRVTHPNVARVYDLGEHAGVLFLTMELVEGGTLRTLLHGGRRLPLRRALGIARSIADGLAAAHAVGVVHRDLKPGNVLLDTRGRVVLTDFGVARAMSDELSLTVGAIGTPSYMAPEQAANAGVDPRTDLYALGLVIAEMLTGELPRGGAPAAERAVAGSGAPAALASLVGRCLAVNPHERPGDAAAVAQVLAAAIDALDHDGDTETERAAAISNASPGPKSGVGVQPPVPTGPVTGVRATAFDMAETAVVGARRADDGSCAPAPPPFDRALAVLPFRFRGPADQAYLGDALGDELVDQLSRTRGLRVFASGATSRFRDDRDPRLVGRELGADVVIDGVAARDGDTLRITTRLLDGKSGVQLWSDRVDVRFSDALGVAESIARRVAEELRVEITLLSRNGRAPDEVVSTYFAARRRLRVPDASAIQEAIEGFSRCIDLAPSFAPAYAGLAMVSLRRWFVFEDRDRTLQAAAEDAIECASAHAPELAETHLAAAMYAAQLGEYPRAVKELERALTIAPTYPDAHEYLGMLECEAGRSREGVERLRRALELDPTVWNARLTLARYYELRGEHAACDAMIAELEAILPPMVLTAKQLRVRIASWREDRDALVKLVDEPGDGVSRTWGHFRIWADVALERRPVEDVEHAVREMLAARHNPRFVSFLNQLLAEAHARHGDPDAALRAIDAAGGVALIDVDWLERCPSLRAIRGRPQFVALAERARVRADALWR